MEVGFNQDASSARSLRRVSGPRAGLVGKPYPVRIERRFQPAEHHRTHLELLARPGADDDTDMDPVAPIAVTPIETGAVMTPLASDGSCITSLETRAIAPLHPREIGLVDDGHVQYSR